MGSLGPFDKLFFFGMKTAPEGTRRIWGLAPSRLLGAYPRPSSITIWDDPEVGGWTESWRRRNVNVMA